MEGSPAGRECVDAWPGVGLSSVVQILYGKNEVHGNLLQRDEGFGGQITTMLIDDLSTYRSSRKPIVTSLHLW